MVEHAHNEGVQIDRSTIYGPVAGGAQARAVQYGSGKVVLRQDLQDRLAELRRLIRTHAAEIDDVENALRDVDDIEAEAGRDNADPRRLRDALARLGERVARAGAVATAVYEIGQLLQGLLP